MRPLICGGFGGWNVGDTGDCWLAKAMPSDIDPSADCGEKRGYGLEEVVGEKKLPTLEDASEPVLDGWRCPFGRF